MKVRAQTLEAYVERAHEILDHIELQYESTDAFDDIWDRTVCELESIIKEPNGNPKMEFREHNTRYPYYQTIPGLLAETITAVNLYQHYGWSFAFATNWHTQYTLGIDMWINPTYQDHTLQVKAVRFLRDKLDGKTDFSNIKTDWVSLVDIDDYHHFFIERNMFLSAISEDPCLTIETLNTLATNKFDNIELYGSKEDRLVRGLISK